MRSRDPRILRFVRKSLCETILVALLFLNIFVWYTCMLNSLARTRVKLYFQERSYRINCQTDPSEWGRYCKRLAIKRLRNTNFLLFKHILAFAITVSVISGICAELVFEFLARCREFCRWYWNTYRLNTVRHNSRGG